MNLEDFGGLNQHHTALFGLAGEFIYVLQSYIILYYGHIPLAIRTPFGATPDGFPFTTARCA